MEQCQDTFLLSPAHVINTEYNERPYCSGGLELVTKLKSVVSDIDSCSMTALFNDSCHEATSGSVSNKA